MPFGNPILGGTTLVRPAIHSPNYTPGSLGWTINQDGSAEFNDVTIRGGTVISGTDLYYSGTPAAGNLILAISATAGTDSFGNTYPAGVTLFNANGSQIRLYTGTYTNTNWNLDGTFLTIQPANDPPLVWTPGAIGTSIIALTGGDAPMLIVSSPCAAGKTTSSLTLQADNAGGDGAKAEIDADKILISPSNYTELFGTTLSVNGIYSDRTGGGVAESWHAASLNAPWTNRGAGWVPLQYRMLASPPKSVQIMGEVLANGAANGSTLFTLPAGYYNLSHATSFPVSNSGISGINAVTVCQVSTTGLVQLFNNAGWGTSPMQLNGMISLDA